MFNQASLGVLVGLLGAAACGDYNDSPGEVNLSAEAVSTAAISFVGLEAYYKFDEMTGSTAFDASGNARDGCLNGSANFSHDDKPHVCNDLSVMSVPNVGTDSVTVANDDGAFDLTGSFSVAAWVKIPAVGDGPIIGARSVCSHPGWEIGKVANKLYYTTQSTFQLSTADLAAGAWTHIAVTFDVDHSMITMYLNGEQDSTASFGLSNTTLGMPLTIGHGDCSGTDVLLDELQIYSRVLAPEEVTTLGRLPQVPQNLHLSFVSSTTMSLIWDVVPGATGYLIYRGTGAGDETYFASSGPLASFTDGHLAPGTTYSWRVASVLDCLYSDPSDAVSGTTLRVMDAPLDVTATATSSSRIRIDWDEVDRASYYYIYESTSAAGPFVYLSTVRAPVITFIAAGLTTMTHYWYKVVALDASLVPSPQSMPADATTLPLTDAPVGVTATATFSGRIRIDWQPVDRASYYYIYESTSADGPFVFRSTVRAPTQTFSATGLTAVTHYWYKVVAYDATLGQSPPSAPADTITLPLIGAPPGVSATATSSSRIRIDWDPVDRASFYYIYESTSADGPFAFLATVRAPAVTFIAAGLTSMTHYWYQVVAVDAILLPSSPSAQADALTP